MENLKKLAQAKIEEMQSNQEVFATEAKGETWSALEDGTGYVSALAEPVEASFSKKENKEQTAYTGMAYAVKFSKTSEKDGSAKYNQLVLGVFTKVGSKDEAAEMEVRRTRVSSGEKSFKRLPTKVLVEKIG